MSTAIVKRLVYKDWYLQRWPVTGYLLAAAVGAALPRHRRLGVVLCRDDPCSSDPDRRGVQLSLSKRSSRKNVETLPFI